MNRTLSLISACVFGCLISRASAQCWSERFGDPNAGGLGFDADVLAFASFNDGGGAQLYAGGFMSRAGDGLSGIPVAFIARWNGAAWSSVGGGLNNFASCFEVFDDGGGPALYVGGAFTQAGATSVSRIARWDGANWRDVGGGLSNGSFGATVQALTSFDDGNGLALYAIGNFTFAGSTAVSNVARWDGANWADVGGGLDSTGYALHVHDDGGGLALFAGGAFTLAGGNVVNGIARWNGATWSALGSGLGGSSFPAAATMTSFDDGAGPVLVVGGEFLDAGGVAAAHIASWNGAAWAPLGAGASGHPFTYVDQLHVHDDGAGPALYAGGLFTSMGFVSANYIARRRGGSWSGIDYGVDSTNNPAVWALASFDDGAGQALWVGGSFEFVGGAGTQQSFVTSWKNGACALGATVCSGDGTALPCPCGNTAAPGAGCDNSNGTGGARLTASSLNGAASLGADSVRFELAGLPANTVALFFQGDQFAGGAGGFPFADGLLCAGGVTRRLIARPCSSSTSFGFGVGGDPAFSSLSSLPPGGGALIYQAWYRDNAVFCAPSRSNTSNGVFVTWTP